MSTTAVSGSSAASTTSTTSTQTESTLDRDAFLKLLITQLQNQDPMNPMENTEYISQLAQFTSLEQMQSVNTNLESLLSIVDSNLGSLLSNQSAYSALNLIGREVKYTDSESKETLTGTVDSIKFENGIPILKIGDKDVSVASVVNVS